MSKRKAPGADDFRWKVNGGWYRIVKGRRAGDNDYTWQYKNSDDDDKKFVGEHHYHTKERELVVMDAITDYDGAYSDAFSKFIRRHRVTLLHINRSVVDAKRDQKIGEFVVSRGIRRLSISYVYGEGLPETDAKASAPLNDLTSTIPENQLDALKIDGMAGKFVDWPALQQYLLTQTSLCSLELYRVWPKDGIFQTVLWPLTGNKSAVDRLSTLDIAEADLRGDHWNVLARLQALEHLRVTSHNTVNYVGIFRMLRTLPVITSVYLMARDDSKLSSFGDCGIVDFISDATSLRKLVVRSIGGLSMPRDWPALFDAATHSSTLQELTLSSRVSVIATIDPKPLTALIRFLKSPVNTIRIFRCGLDGAFAFGGILRSLTTNVHLRHLRFVGDGQHMDRKEFDADTKLVREKNKTIECIHCRPFVPDSGEEWVQFEENRSRNKRLDRNWARLAFLIAFCRANSGSAIVNSGLALTRSFRVKDLK